MANDARVCRQCGTGRTDDALHDLCPQCVLKQVTEDQASRRTVSPDAKTVIDSAPKPWLPPSQPSPIETRESEIGNPKVRYFGDYELLGEIARGGMGVIYKARQVSLNRIVAVKMILSGQLASETEVQRFRTEAEAAANLQHPHIVAIHEIGQHEGSHYFSMDYIEGKNLAEWAGEHPVPPREAARLVRCLAQAVQYAHQRGILHRDLKPQNILIDSDGQPRITDFGLAKRIERDMALTRAGAVMGSPSYMPPEQATGRLDLVGPQSDVYALGAVLYKLLTGCAPFMAPTQLETLRQVVEAEPARPSKINAGLPPDLETICLKCLEKRPERRYSSARDLAEELERFLNQEPIRARPASAMRRASSWSLRRPWILTGISTLLLLAVVGLAYGLWVFVKKERRRVLLLESHALLQSTRVGDTAASTNYLKGMTLLEEAARLHPGRDLTHEAMGWMALGEKAARRIPHRHGGMPGGTNVLSVDLSKDGHFLAASFDDGAVEIFRTSDGSIVHEYPKASSARRFLAISADGRWLATAQVDSRPAVIELWDWQTTQTPIRLASHEGPITALAFSPDGRHVASAGRGDQATLRSPEVKLWDLFTKTLQQTVAPFERNSDQHSLRDLPYYYEEKINRLLFNHQGFGLAAISEKHTIRFLILTNVPATTTNAMLLEHFPDSGHGDWAAFAPDGLQLAVYGQGEAGVHGLFKKFPNKNEFYLSLWRGGATGPSYFTPDSKQVVDFHPVHGHSWWRDVRGLRSETRTADTPLDTPVPGQALAIHPDGTVLTLDRESRSFLFWHPDRVRAELREFGLTQCLPTWTDLPFRHHISKKKDPLLRPVLMNLPQFMMMAVLGFFSLMAILAVYNTQTKGLRFKDMLDPVRAQNTPRRRQAHPLMLGTMAVGGAVGTLFGVYLLLKAIDAYIWQAFISFETLFFALGLIWMGALLVWQSAWKRRSRLQGWVLAEPQQLAGGEFTRIAAALYSGDRTRAVEVYRMASQASRGEAEAVIEELAVKLYKQHPQHFQADPFALEWNFSCLFLILLLQLALLLAVYEIAKPNWQAPLLADLVTCWFMGFATSAHRVFARKWGAAKGWLILLSGVMVAAVISVIVSEQLKDPLKPVEQTNKFVLMSAGIIAGTVLGQCSIKKK